MKYLKTSFLLILVIAYVHTYGQDAEEKKDKIGRSPADTVRIDPFNGRHVELTGQELADASFPKSWPLFGSESRMSIGGFVKLDYLQDFNGIHNDRFELATYNVHVDNSGVVKEAPYMNLFARESNFHFDFRSMTKQDKPLRLYLEMDFWNLDRAPFFNVPRIRHFYAVYNRWLVGRSWGLLTDLYSFPTTLDFEAGDAISGSRRAQLRYEQALNKKVKVAGAIEMMEYPDIDPNGFDGQPSMLLPSFSARITKDTKLGGRIFFGGSIYQLRWDGLETGPYATAVGWGFIFSGRQNFTEKFAFKWNTSGGKGWGSNIVALLGREYGAMITPDEELETMYAWNASLSVVYNFSPILITNITGGWAQTYPSEYKGPNDFRSGATGHINLIYSPAKSINVGAEYQIGRRLNIDGKSGIANRIQISGKYIF